MKPFESELDVRRWIKKHADKAGAFLAWVEASAGGTNGFPDTVMIKVGKALFLELKVGVMGKDGRLEFQMRNAQRIVLRKMEDAGAEVAVLVGEKDSTRVWALKPSDITVKPGAAPSGSGKVNSSIPHHGPGRLLEEGELP